MGAEKIESVFQKALKKLCRDNGWSYGVFWRFDQQNSLLLTTEDTYHEEQMGVLIDNMLLQVHLLGNGVVGQAAFTKQHRWLFSDAHCGVHNPVGPIHNQDLFQNNSEIHFQFSYGIETVAVISVEPLGVVQFGSTHKIPERIKFADQTKILFQAIENSHAFVLPEDKPSSSNSKNCVLSGLLASLISSGNSILGNPIQMHHANSRNSMDTTATSTDLPRLSPFTSSRRIMNSSSLGNQLEIDGTSTPLKLTNKSNWLQEPLVKSNIFFNPSWAPSPCISTWSNGQSTLTSIEEQLPSQSRLLGDCTAAHSKSFPEDNCPSQIFPSLEHRINTVSVEVSSVSSSLNGADIFGSIPFNHPSNTVHGSVTNAFNSNNVENDLFESLGLDPQFIQAEGFLDDILMPLASVGLQDFDADTSECISKEGISTVAGPQGRLFSTLGLDQFFHGNANSSNSIASSSFEDDLSSGRKQKTRSCPVGGGNMYSWQPLLILEPKKEAISKSEAGSLVGDSYSIIYGSKCKRPGESAKVCRKKARSGSRPKPKDRQQIQDRISELRKLIPNGLKMSIDYLLAQTIKHMLFLQSVTNHAENLKQAEEGKVNVPVLRDNSGNIGYIAVWASEFEAQTMVDPVDVKDLRLPGQKLIQILCEEKGFLLEIVEIIQGLALTILKGVMEIRKEKIWACFVVEAEAKRHVTKQQIYLALHQLLCQINLSHVINGGTTVFNDYHHSLMNLPIIFDGLEETQMIDQ